MSGKVYLYPIWIRLWHLTNALLCLILIITGISMHYASPDAPRIRFDIAVSMHNISGILLSVSYVVFFLGNLFTGNGINYVVQFRDFLKRMGRQIYYYSIGFFKKEPAPFPIGSARKFNPLQQVTYAAVMYFFVPVIIITGWGMLFPDAIFEEWLGINGYALTDLLHILGGFVITLFLLIHLYFSTMGAKPSDHFKAMISGYHEDESAEAEHHKD